MNAISPSHYQFRHGAQLIDLTEQQRFNPGNATKCISRSCRLDDQNKGQRLEDLRKAVWYLTREQRRLHSALRLGGPAAAPADYPRAAMAVLDELAATLTPNGVHAVVTIAPHAHIHAPATREAIGDLELAGSFVGAEIRRLEREG
ncbi:MAG: DUF3310 domain-containing protein [Microbacteriaceae bacterium]